MKEWLFDKFAESMCDDKIKQIAVDSGRTMCPNIFMRTLDLDHNAYYRALKKYRGGACAAGSSYLRKKGEMTATSVEAIDWMEEYFTSHGDRMPDRDEIHLPYKTRMIYVYRRYLEDTFSPEKEQISRAQFYRLWGHHFPNVKAKKVISLYLY